MVRYEPIPERLYAGLSEIAQNPEIFLPKKWEFLKVETVLKRHPDWSEAKAPILNSPAMITSFVSEVLRDLQLSDRERMYVIFIDNNMRVNGLHEVTVGDATASMAPPKELFRAAILAAAVHVIIIHNHPSGNLKFSQGDLAVLRRLQDVGKLVDIKILDFIVIGLDGKYIAASDRGLV